MGCLKAEAGQGLYFCRILGTRPPGGKFSSTMESIVQTAGPLMWGQATVVEHLVRELGRRQITPAQVGVTPVFLAVFRCRRWNG